MPLHERQRLWYRQLPAWSNSWQVGANPKGRCCEYLDLLIGTEKDLTRRFDAQVIFEEGVSSLSTKELQQAAQSRGIRTIGISPSRLREELETWIDLHYTNKISGVLLILSRAFDWVRASSGDKSEGVIRSLQSVLSTLPDTLVRLSFTYISSVHL